MRINLRRGTLRIWLVGTVAWILYVGWSSSYEIGYAYRFYFHRAEVKGSLAEFRAEDARSLHAEREALTRIEARKRAELAEFEKATGLDQTFRKAGTASLKPPADPRIAELDEVLKGLAGRDPEPSPPEWFWLVKALLPPPLIGLVVFVTALIVRWISRGFSGARGPYSK